MNRHAEILAGIAAEVVQQHRDGKVEVEVDDSMESTDVEVHESWLYTLPVEFQD